MALTSASDEIAGVGSADASLVRYVASSTTAPARVASSTARPNAARRRHETPAPELEHTADRLEARLRLGVDRFRQRALDDAQARIVGPATQRHERAHGCRRRPPGALEEAIGRVEVGGIPCKTGERRPGTRGPFAVVRRDRTPRGASGLVVVATPARDLRPQGVDLCPLDAHERDPGAAGLARARKRPGELHRERRSGEGASHVVLCERERLDVRDRARELANEARRSLLPISHAPLERARLATTQDVFERPRRRLTSSGKLDDARDQGPFAGILDAERPGGGARAHERHEPARAPHRPERLDDAGRGGIPRGRRGRRSEPSRRAGGLLDPRARRLTDRG